MFRLLNKMSKAEKPTACIVDEAGRWPIDENYREMGVREGWLRYTGHYRDHKNNLIDTYIHLKI